MEDLEEALNKKIVVDIATLPAGLTIEEWLYYFEGMDICFIDSRKNSQYTPLYLDNQ